MHVTRLASRLAVGVGIVVAPLAGVIATQTAGAATPTAVVVSATEPDDSATDSSDAATDAACPTDDAATAASSEAADAESEAGAFDGEWVIADGSYIQYRVPEQLAGVDTEAVGEGTDITGSFTFSGSEATAGCIVVDTTTIASDESMRDGQFHSRIMETETYPTATFVLTEPIVFDELPEVDGDSVTATITGELTLHGVTNEVSFDAEVQAVGELVGVLGEIPILFDDYAIEDPSGGPAQVGDEGTLIVVLAFERA